MRRIRIVFSEGEESPEALRKLLGTIPGVGWNLQSGQLLLLLLCILKQVIP